MLAPAESGQRSFRLTRLSLLFDSDPATCVAPVNVPDIGGRRAMQPLEAGSEERPLAEAWEWVKNS